MRGHVQDFAARSGAIRHHCGAGRRALSAGQNGGLLDRVNGCYVAGKRGAFAGPSLLHGNRGQRPSFNEQRSPAKRQVAERRRGAVLLQAKTDDADSRQPASERRSQRRLQRPVGLVSILLDAHYKCFRARTIQRRRVDAYQRLVHRHPRYSHLRS